MEVTEKKRKGNNLKLNIKVEPEKVDQALEQAYREVAKEVSVPGFREGKVPRKVLEAKYGPEILHKDALDIIIPDAYSEAISEIGAEPIDRPDIEDYYIAEGEYATFTARVEVKPEVELGQYTGLDLEYEDVEVEQEEVNNHLSRLQDQHSQLEFTDKEIIEEGDTAVIDFEGFIDGEPFEGGSGEEFNLEIGSGQFIPGFEEKLIGEKTGTEVELEVDFPDDYQAEDLAGKTAVFNVDIKEIKEKVVPELDDDFAREVSDYDTIEEFKDSVRSQIKEQKKQQTDQDFEEKLFDAIADDSEFELPEKLIENELDSMFQRFKINLSQQGMEIEDYFEYTGMDEQDWRDQNYDSAVKSVRNNLLLEAVAKKEDIEVSDSEVESKIKEIAEANDQDFEEMKSQMEEYNQLDSIKESIKMEKTMEFLKKENTADDDSEDSAKEQGEEDKTEETAEAEEN